MIFFKRFQRQLKKPHFRLVLAPFLFLAIFLILITHFNPINSPVAVYLSHSWRSIKKFPNIFYYSALLSKSNLPEYRLVINADDLKTLNDELPINHDDLSYGFLSDENKKYVSGYFLSSKDNYAAKVKVRYRGLIKNNWQAEKKSLRIKFPKDSMFLGMSAVNLIIPEDRGYFLESLNIYRAEKLGLFVPKFSFVKIYVNNRYFGVYLIAEAWSRELLAKNNTIDTGNILSNKDEIDKIKDENPAFYNWKSYVADNEDGPFEELNALSELTNKAGDKEFSKKIGALVDLNKVYKWQLLNVLAGSAHQSYMTNFVLLFKKETGKFEPIPWNVEYESLKNKIYDDNLPLMVRRIFNDKISSDLFVELLKDHLNENNFKADLAYYDDLVKNLKQEFYKDQAKNQNNLEFDAEVRRGRELIKSNYAKAQELVNKQETRQIIIWEKLNISNKLNFDGTFEYFNQIFTNIDEFVLRNTQFYKLDDKTIVLASGTHIFTKNVIIPSDLKLIIQPGASLLFYPDVSLISYSSVIAKGTLENPIIIKNAFLNSKAWGSFGVINTGDEKNYFKHVQISGGSSAVINGVPFLSQLDIRNSNSVIDNSVFQNGNSDDGLHVVSGSIELRNNLFKDNSSDSIDLDYVSNSIIENNRFFNSKSMGSNGDGIDLSGTENVMIRKNEILYQGDKCISVGEHSEARIENNILAGCGMGVAVKDNSSVILSGNIVIKNKIGLSLYRKKQEFIKGGQASVINSIIWDNGKEIEVDEFSGLEIKNSTVKNGYMESKEINTDKPDFKSLLPAYLFNLIK